MLLEWQTYEYPFSPFVKSFCEMKCLNVIFCEKKWFGGAVSADGGHSVPDSLLYLADSGSPATPTLPPPPASVEQGSHLLFCTLVAISLLVYMSMGPVCLQKWPSVPTSLQGEYQLLGGRFCVPFALYQMAEKKG